MDSKGKTTGTVTPVKDPKSNKSNISETPKKSENFNPNVTSPGLKFSNSPSKKSATKTQKPLPKTHIPVASPSPRNKVQSRKLFVPKKNSNKEKVSCFPLNCMCEIDGKSQKCLCVVNERPSEMGDGKNNCLIQNSEKIEGGDLDKHESDEVIEVVFSQLGGVEIKRRVPQHGSGRVLNLVKAFEKLLSIPESKESDQNDEKELGDRSIKGLRLVQLSGLEPPKVTETMDSTSSLCPSDLFLTSKNLGFDSRVSSSSDSSQGRFSISSRTSSGGDRRSRRNSTESSGTSGERNWKRSLKRRQLKATSQKPFKLRTEQRGRYKEEEFIKKVQQVMDEGEKQRIPIAQGLPRTTDEPECLVKPWVKESTRPIDLVLHSEIRAVERSEFDNQVAEKMNYIEEYRRERERLQKLAEEEEIRRLRKELVPKAQPMPYFDRPFIPRRRLKRSVKPDPIILPREGTQV